MTVIRMWLSITKWWPVVLHFSKKQRNKPLLINYSFPIVVMHRLTHTHTFCTDTYNSYAPQVFTICMLPNCNWYNQMYVFWAYIFPLAAKSGSRGIMGIDLATWRARIGLNYYHACRPLQIRWRSSGLRLCLWVPRVYSLCYYTGSTTESTDSLLKFKSSMDFCVGFV